MENTKIGNKEAQDKDILGRIYEYFLGQFASNELQKGGEFYTPAEVSELLARLVKPQENDRIYDIEGSLDFILNQLYKAKEEAEDDWR